MRPHELEHDGKEHAVELRDAGEHRVVARIASGETTNELEVDATRLPDGRWIVRRGAEVIEARVESGPGAALTVRFASGNVVLERLDPFRDAVKRGRGGGSGARKIVAPIPGRVVDVLVAVGDEVQAGQPVIVVEAMKMANELRAPVAGRVTRLDVAKGAAVEAGTLLAVIEG